MTSKTSGTKARLRRHAPRIWAWVSLVILVWVAWILYAFNLWIFRQLRPGQVLLDLAFVIAMAGGVKLLYHFFPGLSWWIGRLVRAKGEASNTSLAPLKDRWIGMAYWLLVLFTMPSVTMVEEYIFRRGTHDIVDAIWRSLLFAAVHMVVGVPLVGMFSLTAMGMWMSYWYLRGDLVEATIHHTTCNLWAVSALFAVIMYKRFQHEPDAATGERG